MLKQIETDSVDTPGKELRDNCAHNNTGWIENQFISGTCRIVLKTVITKKIIWDMASEEPTHCQLQDKKRNKRLVFQIQNRI